MVPSTSSPASSQDVAQPLLLEGTPTERGLARGETLRGQIHAVIGRWQDDVARFYRMDTDRAIGRFIRGTDFLATIRHWTPGLLDEIRGIATGADLPWETVLAFRLLDEMWSNEDDILAEHWSSLGFPAGGSEPAIIAENVDVESFRDGFQVLLHIKHADSDLESFVLTIAGVIGFNGLNNRSVATHPM